MHTKTYPAPALYEAGSLILLLGIAAMPKGKLAQISGDGTSLIVKWLMCAMKVQIVVISVHL